MDGVSTALALITVLADREKIEAIREKAENIGAAVVIEAPSAKLKTFAPPKASNPGYRKQHHVGNFVIEYAHIRGRDWLANIYRDGKFVTEAPVAWKNDRRDGVQTIWFTTKERANKYLGRESFLIVSRITNDEAARMPTPFEAVLLVEPTGEADEKRENAHGIDARVIRIES